MREGPFDDGLDGGRVPLAHQLGRDPDPEAAEAAGVALEVRTDRHFFSTIDDFRAHAVGRKQLRLEFYYRELRRKHGVLLDAEGGPEGGEWNYDHDNRGSFGRGGPGKLPAPVSFPPDAITREVLALVARRFPKHPGRLEAFDWAVTPEDAHRAEGLHPAPAG